MAYFDCCVCKKAILSLYRAHHIECCPKTDDENKKITITSENTEKLKEEIAKLKEENEALKDSLAKIKYQEFHNKSENSKYSLYYGDSVK